MLESELHPCGAIAFAEARGQTGPEVVEEIVLKKFAKVNEVLEKHTEKQACVTKGELVFNPGTCSI